MKINDWVQTSEENLNWKKKSHKLGGNSLWFLWWNIRIKCKKYHRDNIYKGYQVFLKKESVCFLSEIKRIKHRSSWDITHIGLPLSSYFSGLIMVCVLILNNIFCIWILIQNHSLWGYIMIRWTWICEDYSLELFFLDTWAAKKSSSTHNLECRRIIFITSEI